MWAYLQPLLSTKFWFSLTPPPFTPWAGRFILFLMLTLAVVGMAVLAYVVFNTSLDKEMRRVYRRAAAWLFWAGATGLVLYGFTWQGVPVLSARFFYLIWLAAFAWWAYVIGKYAFKDLPALQADRVQKEAYEKWLPKPKR